MFCDGAAADVAQLENHEAVPRSSIGRMQDHKGHNEFTKGTTLCSSCSFRCERRDPAFQTLKNICL